MYLIVKLYLFYLTVFWFAPQIQNADDVLITPLEKFRKEQIGAAKARPRPLTHTPSPAPLCRLHPHARMVQEVDALET